MDAFRTESLYETTLHGICFLVAIPRKLVNGNRKGSREHPGHAVGDVKYEVMKGNGKAATCPVLLLIRERIWGGFAAGTFVESGKKLLTRPSKKELTKVTTLTLGELT